MPSVQTLVRDVDLFQSLRPWFFPGSYSDKPSLTGLDTLTLRTVASSQFFSGTQAQRAGTPPISLQRLAEGFMRLFFKKPVITSPTSPISSLRTTPFTFWNTDGHILLCTHPQCVMNMRNKEGLSADITNTSVCGDDVLDRDVAHQSHVSAHLVPSSPITHK